VNRHNTAAATIALRCDRCAAVDLGIVRDKVNGLDDAIRQAVQK
jgi:hypothetical protein